MDLHDYQEKAVNACHESWREFNRILGVAATGAGKTIIAGHVFKQRYSNGPALFVAHRDELLQQALDKLGKVMHSQWGISIGLEQAENRATHDDDIVVASVQSLHPRRLKRWDPDHFQTIIIDECHRSTAKSYKNVLNYFTEAKTLGITATPDRSDHRSLGEIFESIAFEIGLIQLINDKWLAPIRVEQIPLTIDLEGVSIDNQGDLDVTEAGHRLEPYLGALADELVKRPERKTLVFLPLVKLSQQFAEIAQSKGVPAEHIDGQSVDRRQILKRFHDGVETRVLSCAMLLSEGYDEPSVDCIVMMRPTQSRTLYAQCLGRGFRTCEGKTDLLVLDPLWLSSEHSLVRPANLVAKSEQEAQEIAALFDEEPDLLKAQARNDQAHLAAVQERANALAAVLDATSKRERQMFDPIEVAATLGIADLANFEATMAWHSRDISDKQSQLLANWGINPANVQSRGHASAIIDRLMIRKNNQLASFRQLRYLIRFGHPNPHRCTFKEATEFLSRIWGDSRNQAQPARI